MRSMCLMWCGSNEASEWFTIWTMSDERQETMVLYLRIWHFDSIPFFSEYRIYWHSVESAEYTHLYTSAHTHTKTRSHLWCCCWIATNSIKYSNFHEHQLDIRFEFHIKQLVHSIRIRRNANARKPNAFWYTHTHTFFANRWLISVVDVMCRLFHFSIEMQLNWCANFRITHSHTYHRNPEW